MHITVRQLAKAYGALWALRDVNLDLPPGECVALLGPNGAGKTTLLKLLGGLLYPTAGDIAFNGDKFRGNEAKHRSTIGFLTPGEHLYENLTVRENLLFFACLYKRYEAIGRIDTVLDEVGLKQRSEEYVANLSSGMKCRLSIAKWQLLDPGMLLLDEPYGVLDGSGVDILEGFVRAQLKKGNVVVVASHHVARVLQLCTRALILHQGRLTFDEQRRQPWPSLTRAFVDFIPHGEPWNS